MSAPRTRGFRTFLVIWAGQTVSMLGTGLTAFALGVWVYLETGSVTRFALIHFSAALPVLIVSPFAGALVDRWDRRRTLIVSDLAAGLSSAALFTLLVVDRLEMWHIYALLGFAAIFNAFQWPAFTASTTLLVPPRFFSQAAAMSQMGMAISQVTGPALGGILLVTVGLEWVIAIDFVTFLVAIGTLAAVRIPAPDPIEPEEGEDASLLGEMRRGWRYVKDRQGLMGLLLLFAVANFSIGMLQALLPPLMLSFTTAPVLGTVLSVAGFGMVLGTVLMSVWSGPRRRVAGVYGPVFLQGVICLLGAFRPNVWLVGGAVFAFLFAMPMAVACSQAIWQNKVPPALQGRVFAIRRVVALSAAPIAYAVAGPLADGVFEPAMAPGGALASTVGRVLGTGEGRGVAVLFVLLGFLMLLSGAVALSSRRVRDVESDLPDAVPSEPEPGDDPAPSSGPFPTSVP